MYNLPERVEDWSQQDCSTLLSELKGYYGKYNVQNFYVIGSRCNGLYDPQDIDISLDLHNDVVTWRNLDLNGNFAELMKRSIYEKRLTNTFGSKFNVIIEKDCSQRLYNTMEKFPMPYFDLSTMVLYNKKRGEKFPYKIITYDYDNHIFYMKLRPQGLTSREIEIYTQNIYKNLSPAIAKITTISDSDKAFMLSGPYNIIIYLTNLALNYTDLDKNSKLWIKNNSIILKNAEYKTMSSTIQKGLNLKNSDLFVKLFHDTEIYENLSVF